MKGSSLGKGKPGVWSAVFWKHGTRQSMYTVCVYCKQEFLAFCEVEPAVTVVGYTLNPAQSMTPKQSAANQILEKDKWQNSIVFMIVKPR